MRKRWAGSVVSMPEGGVRSRVNIEHACVQSVCELEHSICPYSIENNFTSRRNQLLFTSPPSSATAQRALQQVAAKGGEPLRADVLALQDLPAPPTPAEQS